MRCCPRGEQRRKDAQPPGPLTGPARSPRALFVRGAALWPQEKAALWACPSSAPSPSRAAPPTPCRAPGGLPLPAQPDFCEQRAHPQAAPP